MYSKLNEEGSGFAHNWTVIVGVRILVGAFEAGFVYVLCGV
jgi:hypothetical protein